MKKTMTTKKKKKEQGTENIFLRPIIHDSCIRTKQKKKTKKRECI